MPEDVSKVIAIVVLFSITLFAYLFQLARIFYYQHNPRCVHSAFILLCTLWCASRIAYFSSFLSGALLATQPMWETFVYHTLFLLPVVLQFATFSLLVLFYVSLVHEEHWHSGYQRAFITAWWLVNGAVVVLFGAEIIVEVTSAANPALVLAGIGFTGMVVGIMVILLAYYGLKLVRLTASTLKNRLFSGMPLTRMKVLVITFTLLTIYLTRFLYDVLALFDADTRMSIVSDTTPGGMKNLAFAFLVLWELLPMSIVLVVFRVPSSGMGLEKNSGVFPDEAAPPLLRSETGPLRSFSHRKHTRAPSMGRHTSLVSSAQRFSRPSVEGLFNDERRYDSDGEQTPGPARSLHFVFAGEFSPGMPPSVADQAASALRDPTGMPEPFETVPVGSGLSLSLCFSRHTAHPAPISMWGGPRLSMGGGRPSRNPDPTPPLPDRGSINGTRPSLRPGSSVTGLRPLELPD